MFTKPWKEIPMEVNLLSYDALGIPLPICKDIEEDKDGKVYHKIDFDLYHKLYAKELGSVSYSGLDFEQQKILFEFLGDYSNTTQTKTLLLCKILKHHLYSGHKIQKR
jgi:hypothetical protein